MLSEKFSSMEKRHPNISRYVKSLRVFRQGIGGDLIGRMVIITEFQSLTEMEEFYELLNKDEEWTKIKKEWASVIDMSTMQVSLWNDRLRDLWIEKKGRTGVNYAQSLVCQLTIL